MAFIRSKFSGHPDANSKWREAIKAPLRKIVGIQNKLIGKDDDGKDVFIPAEKLECGHWGYSTIEVDAGMFSPRQTMKRRCKECMATAIKSK